MLVLNAMMKQNKQRRMERSGRDRGVGEARKREEKKTRKVKT